MQSPEDIKPYSAGDPKGAQVEEMFDNIAPAYDRMNTLMTLGLHNKWRETALRAALKIMRDNGLSPDHADILDVATGTGDLVFSLHRTLPSAHITGIDLSEGMLEIARRKLLTLPLQEQGMLRFMKADCLQLPFADNSFDLVTVAYGVRNFENLSGGFCEMARVLRPGGVLCVVELSVPRNALLRGGYNLYTRYAIPTIGRLVSGDARAYSYLPESIVAAPQRDDMTRLMRQAGLKDCHWRSMTLGTITLYWAVR